MTEASVRRCFVKELFLKTSQNSQERTCARVSFLAKSLWHRCIPVNFAKFLRPATLLKKRLWHKCFPVNFAKFLRTLFFTEHLWWLLLTFPKPISCHWSLPTPPENIRQKSFLKFKLTFDLQHGVIQTAYFYPLPICRTLSPQRVEIWKRTWGLECLFFETSKAATFHNATEWIWIKHNSYFYKSIVFLSIYWKLNIGAL